MMAKMPSRLFAEWQAYGSLEPFGDELTDAHFARLNATVVDVNRKRGSNPTDPQKFRLWRKIANFDPQSYFNDLKAALTFKKWKE